MDSNIREEKLLKISTYTPRVTSDEDVVLLAPQAFPLWFYNNRREKREAYSCHSAMQYVSQSTRNIVHLSRETRNFSNHRPIRKDALSRNRHVHSIPGRGEIYYRGEVTRTSEMLDGWAVINYTTSTPLVLPVTAGPSSGFPDGKHSLDDPSFTLSLLGPRTTTVVGRRSFELTY